MTRITFTTTEVHELSESFGLAAHCLRQQAVGMCDTYAAVVRATLTLLENDAFPDELRESLTRSLTRQAADVASMRGDILKSADHFTMIATTLDRRRAVAPR